MAKSSVHKLSSFLPTEWTMKAWSPSKKQYKLSSEFFYSFAYTGYGKALLRLFSTRFWPF